MIRKLQMGKTPCSWVEDNGTRCIAAATWEIRRGAVQADLEIEPPPSDVQRKFFCGRHVNQGERLQRTIERQERAR